MVFHAPPVRAWRVQVAMEADVEMVVDGLRVHVRTQGSGPAVILLHGWGSSSQAFSAIADVIARSYTVVSLDFPGCGATPEPDEPWGMDDYVRFTAHIIEQFHFTNVILLGHSHGGRVAIRLATEQGLGFSVDKMILVDSAGILPRRSLAYHARVRAYKICKAILGFPPVRAVFPDALPALQSRLGSPDYQAASPIMRASLVRVVNSDLEPVLASITAETLLIWGEDDQDTPLADARVMDKAIPDSGLVVLPRAGHYSFLDQPYAFARVIESFLKIG